MDYTEPEIPLTIITTQGTFSLTPEEMVKEILIDIGDTVTWYSDKEYTVIAGDPDADTGKLGVNYPHGFNSGVIEDGVFQHTFDVAGKYPYYEKSNPQMKGMIIVGGLYGTPNDSIIRDSQDLPIINCGVGTYLVDGVCKPRPDLIETTNTSITSDEPKILNTNNERISIAHVGETLFVGVKIKNLGDNTKDFVASYRYLISSVGDWSEWTWISSSVNAGKYSDVAIPWNPTVADNYEFDIQIWDNVLDKTIITTEKLIVTVKTTTIESTSPTTTEQNQPKPSFVNESKDPQSYVDRYNNEPEYKAWFDKNYPQYYSIEEAVGLTLTEKIPDWVKNIFGWYAQDQISEDELLNAIKYLINEKILIVN